LTSFVNLRSLTDPHSCTEKFESPFCDFVYTYTKGFKKDTELSVWPYLCEAKVDRDTLFKLLALLELLLPIVVLGLLVFGKKLVDLLL